jgi:hypothetical protein
VDVIIDEFRALAEKRIVLDRFLPLLRGGADAVKSMPL